MIEEDSGPYQPLKGVKVVDVTTVLMGPFATQILGDMGADVIKIESPEGDSHRSVGRARSHDMGLNFLNTGRNKRSLVLNLKRPEAAEIIRRLVAQSDVFISNMRPEALVRLGLDYNVLRQVNPRLIYVSLVGYGRNGRYSGLPAYDDLIQAASGIPWLMQHTGNAQPCYIPLALSDRVVGMAALNPLLAALYARQNGAGGREIEVPMFETMARLVLGDHLGEHVHYPDGGELGYGRLLSSQRRPYRTKDGYLAVLPFANKHWQQLFVIAGREDLMARGAVSDKTANYDELYGFLSELLLEKSSEEWLKILRAADIPAMAMNSLEDLVNDPHLADVGFFQLHEHPSEGVTRMLTVPDGAASVQTQPIRPAPHLGEHSTDILREAGFPENQVREWLDAGVVTQWVAAEPAREAL